MKSRTGGEVVARMLAAEGVEVVFGIIDGTYYGLTSVLAEHGIRLVTPRHESTAAHMAGAYARVTDLVGLESIVEAMREAVPSYRRQHLEVNERALRAGFEAAPPGAARW